MSMTTCCLANRGYVIVAWIWAILFYLGLDPIKWAMAWAMNEDGFRTRTLQRRRREPPPEVRTSGVHCMAFRVGAWTCCSTALADRCSRRRHARDVWRVWQGLRLSDSACLAALLPQAPAQDASPISWACLAWPLAPPGALLP